MGKLDHTLSISLFIVVLGSRCIPAPEAWAEDGGRFAILEENDSLFFNSDKHYTQGLRLSDLTPPLKPESGWNELFNFIGRNTPLFQNSLDRRIAVFLGQSIFTPKNLSIR